MTEPTRSRHPGGRGVRWLFLAAFVALLAGHLLANVWWLRHDNLPQVGDPGVHLGFAKTFYRTFTDLSQPNVLKRFAAGRKLSTGIYPPLLHVSGALSAMAFGDTKAGYTFVNTLFFLGTVAGVYWVARSLFPPWTALYAAFVTSLVPFLCGMSRLFLTNLPSVFFVVCFYVALLRTQRFRHRGWVFVLGVLNGLGFWVRWTTALYYIVPLGVVCLLGLWDVYERETRRVNRARLVRLALNGAMFGLVSAAIILPWFYLRAPDLGEAYTENFASRMTRFQAGAAFAWFTYPVMIVNQGVFLTMAVLGLVGLAVALVRMRRDLALSLVVLWLVGSWAVLMAIWSWRNPTPRYVVPMLPAVALLSVYAIDRLAPHKWRRWAMALFAAVLLFQYGNITFASYGPIARLELPLPVQHRWFQRAGDSGLVVYKDKVDAGPAKYGPPFQGLNWIDRAVGDVVAADIDRHFIRWPQANILLVGALKEAIETVQKDYWPLPNPLARGRRERTIVGSLAPLSRKEPRPVVTARVGTKDGEQPVSLSPVFGESGRLFLKTPCDLSVEFQEEVTLSALSITFPEPALSLTEYAVQYLDSSTGEFANFCPPIGVSEILLGYHFFTFEPVRTNRLLFSVRDTASDSDGAIIRNIEFYQSAQQPRPLVLSGVFPSLDAVDWNELDTKDYVIVAEEAPSGDLPRPLLDEFDVLDRFEAGVIGYWGDCHFTVLARKRRPVITFETDSELRVEVSDDHYPDGRWDLPWWRANQTAAVQNPDGTDYWKSRLPSFAEVSLGAVYEIDGVEIVPYSETHGVAAATVEFWNEQGSGWTTLSPDLWRIDMPKHKTGENKWAPKTLPKPWERPIRTRALRFAFSNKAAAAEQPVYAWVSNVFIYGRPTTAPDGAPAGANIAGGVLATAQPRGTGTVQ